MIGFYNASVILTYLGVVSAVFGMSQAFNGNFKIAILCSKAALAVRQLQTV